MAYVKNWLHCVWGTKSKTPYLVGDLKFELLSHIRSNAKVKGIHIDFINGGIEHLHCLLSLDPEHSLSYVIQLIKGESSHWINKNSLTKFKFSWAEEYYGVSISESHVPSVRDYIKNQEQHHNLQSWQEEIDELIRVYGFDRFPA
jgi:REP element-mobilizing transposase RayT